MQEERKEAASFFSGSRFPPLPFSFTMGSTISRPGRAPYPPPCAPQGSAVPPVRPRSAPFAAPFAPQNLSFLSPPSPLPPFRAAKVRLNDPKECKERAGVENERGGGERMEIPQRCPRSSEALPRPVPKLCSPSPGSGRYPGTYAGLRSAVPLPAVEAALPALRGVRPAQPGGGRSAWGQRPPQRSAGVPRPVPLRCAP